jgi:hypothetical protein
MTPRLAALSALALLCAGAIGATAQAAEAPCELEPRTKCFGIESVSVSLSSAQAGAHPDLTLGVAVKQDPETKPNVFGLRDSYGPTRNIRFNVPPGVIGNPNVLGVPQQCTVQELVGEFSCPNGSQVGIAQILAYEVTQELHEPLYMMQPPGGDVIARLGTYAGIFPTFVDFRVRSEGDYGLVAEVREAPASAKLIELESTFWGVPADSSHDTERCTIKEAALGCSSSPKRPPGSRALPFMTNPTRCGTPLEMGVNAANWAEPQFEAAKEVKALLPTIVGCNKLPFGPALTVNPTNHRTSSPTGLDLTIELPESDGVEVLEPAQVRDIRIDLPQGIAINPGSADGLAVCSVKQVHFGERIDAECPAASKMASTEFEVGALPQRMKGAIYLREPEPGNLFRLWVVADDLGAHVKLPGQLEVDEQTGQIKSVVLDSPQVPLREVKLLFKSGFRAPLMTPPACGTYFTHYELTSWAGGPPAKGDVPMQITEGCDGGGFATKLEAGSTEAQGGAHSPFTFTISREDQEQNIAGLDVALPRGLAATFSGIPRCDGLDATSGHCPAASRIGKVVVADGVGPNPLWVPQPGKDPTAIYLSGPYKDAPLSIVAVVPAQAGPFDLGLEVVRSAVFVNPETGQATAKADPLPQFIEGIPIVYRTINVGVDRPGFALNPTSCAPKETKATLTSSQGKTATPTSPYTASNCAKLGFKPRLSLRLIGGTRRGAHPKLTAVLRPRPGDANFEDTSVALPRSAFLDQAHIGTVCTRVQFAAKACPQASIYGKATAKTPLIEETLEGTAYLRSSSHELPDLVIALKGPPSLPIEVDLVGRVDSVNGGIRTTFEDVPDAPVSEFRLQMQGGRKGLLINSQNLCRSVNKATAKFSAQNGRGLSSRPVMQNGCKGTKRKRGQYR